MGTEAVVALARDVAQLIDVANIQRAPAGFENPALFESAQHAADVAASNCEHYRQLILSERNVGAAGAIYRRNEPFRSALLYRVRGIAGSRLEDLRGQTVRVPSEQVAKRRRLLFRLFKVRDLHP